MHHRLFGKGDTARDILNPHTNSAAILKSFIMNLEHLFTGRTPQANHFGIFGGESGYGGRFFSKYSHYSLSISFVYHQCYIKT